MMFGRCVFQLQVGYAVTVEYYVSSNLSEQD
jgi:hypothetical protein